MKNYEELCKYYKFNNISREFYYLCYKFNIKFPDSISIHDDFIHAEWNVENFYGNYHIKIYIDINKNCKFTMCDYDMVGKIQKGVRGAGIYYLNFNLYD